MFVLKTATVHHFGHRQHRPQSVVYNGHVQLHLLRIVFTRTMPSYMTSHVHMHMHVCTRLRFAYYVLFSIVRNGVNIMKIT